MFRVELQKIRVGREMCTTYISFKPYVAMYKLLSQDILNMEYFFNKDV